MRRVNPLVTLREATGLNVAQLAEQADVSPQAVMRAEQGVYAAPPPAILTALWGLAPEDDLHDYGILMADYHEFQRVVRQDHYGDLDPNYHFFPGPVEVPSLKSHEPATYTIHPFVKWRYDSDITARIAISKFYCVHPSLIFRFEAQSHMCTSPPKELLRALFESGYTTSVLNKFEHAYQEFRELKSSTVSSVDIAGLSDEEVELIDQS